MPVKHRQSKQKPPDFAEMCHQLAAGEFAGEMDEELCKALGGDSVILRLRQNGVTQEEEYAVHRALHEWWQEAFPGRQFAL